MGRNLYDTFPLVRQWIERVDAGADFDLLDLMFNSQDEDLQKTRWQQPALFAFEYALVSQLLALGVKPAAWPGTAWGKFWRCAWPGSFPGKDGFRIITRGPGAWTRPAGLNLIPAP